MNDAIKIRNGIQFAFYPGLPQLLHFNHQISSMISVYTQRYPHKKPIPDITEMIQPLSHCEPVPLDSQLDVNRKVLADQT